MTEEDQPKRCYRCGEDACLVSSAGVITCEDKALVRVRRATKCKRYVAALRVSGSPVCRTPVYEGADCKTAAIQDWNKRYGIL